MRYLISLIMMSCVGLVACSDKDSTPQGVLTDSQKKALEAAKDLDDTLLKADEERRKKLEEETR